VNAPTEMIAQCDGRAIVKDYSHISWNIHQATRTTTIVQVILIMHNYDNAKTASIRFS